MGLLSDIFTWWNGATIGTRVYTALAGSFVGQDEFGNRYYQRKDGSRRWVIYNGYAEASSIPPGWYGWMHKIVDEAPAAEAYRPYGSLYFSKPKPPPSDYEPWQPR